jgi:hypothetical protein
MYRYIFNFQQRIRGLVIVTRYDEHVACPGGDWECLAADNAAALELARHAAFAVWPPVAGRAPNDFMLQFQDAAAPAASEPEKARTKTGVNLKLSADGTDQRRPRSSATGK